MLDYRSSKQSYGEKCPRCGYSQSKDNYMFSIPKIQGSHLGNYSENQKNNYDIEAKQ